MTTPDPAAGAAAAPAYSRTNPFLAQMTANFSLSKPGSAKDTRHMIINLAGSGIKYHVGDSLGVFPSNPPGLVTELLERLKIDPGYVIKLADGREVSIAKQLAAVYTLNRVNKKFVKGVEAKLPEGEAKTKLAAIIADNAQLEEYVHTRDYYDVLREHPEVYFTPEEVMDLAQKTLPRLYSIASSQARYPDEVHLTVAVVKYNTHDRDKIGLASGYLAYHCDTNCPSVPVYIQPTRHFHLPADGNTPLIMVGPGTGIAPFRAFIEQRLADGAKGKNWLFFGDQKKSTDFLYEEEFEGYLTSGHLTRLDTAFSRDQEHKIYVQDRMRENGAELWKWLKDEGAYFYVCGDAKRMAKDVHTTLIEIAKTHGGLSDEAAVEYIEKTLAKTEKRYLKDVY